VKKVILKMQNGYRDVEKTHCYIVLYVVLLY